MRNPANICSYSCKEKREYILKGLAKFSSDENKKSGSMFDFRARQAQFYKDVEMAEVMTDNDIEVANILAQYEVVDDQDQPSNSNAPPPKKKRRKKRN